MPARRPDFAARLRFLSPEEGGRKTLPLSGLYYRPDMRYLDDPSDKLWVIWPRDLTTDDGNPLPSGTPMPSIVRAQMCIINDELRVSEHRSRLHVGTEFQVMEGPHVVAEGIVTELIGLHDD